MADTSQLISKVAERYASSLFDLALEAGAIEAVQADLARFAALLNESADLKRLVESPVFTSQEQLAAISALVAKAGFGALAGNFLKVAAANRRLFSVPGAIAAFHLLAQRHRGEVPAHVTSAHALTHEQEQELKEALKSVTGKAIALTLKVDPSLLGGLIVKVGSQQVDTSLSTKLSTLKLALKEVG